MVFLIHICMTSSIPDGLSFAQLQAMMADAAKPEEESKTLSHREIGRIVIPGVNNIAEEIGDVSGFKHVAMYSLAKLLEYHNDAALKIMADNEVDNEEALAWGRDPGWLQVCLNTLRNIGCGPNDTWLDEDND